LTSVLYVRDQRESIPCPEVISPSLASLEVVEWALGTDVDVILVEVVDVEANSLSD